jgi:hypothetical protein
LSGAAPCVSHLVRAEEATVAERPGRAGADATRAESLPSGSQVGPSTDRIDHAKVGETHEGQLLGQPTARAQQARPSDLDRVQPERLSIALAMIWWTVALRALVPVILLLASLWFGLTAKGMPELGGYNMALWGADLGGLFYGASSTVYLAMTYIALILVDGAFAMITAKKVGRPVRTWMLSEGVVSGLMALTLVGISLTDTPILIVAAWPILTGTIRIVTAIAVRREIESERRILIGGFLWMLSAAFWIFFGVLLISISALDFDLYGWLKTICALASGALLGAFAFWVRKQREAGAAG